MASQQAVENTIRNVDKDLIFLAEHDVVSKRWQVETCAYLQRCLRASYKRITMSSDPLMSADQPPLRPDQPPPQRRLSSPNLLDFDFDIDVAVEDAEMTDVHASSQAASDSAAPTVSFATTIPHTNPAKFHSPNYLLDSRGQYDLDQYEWDAAAEWGGSPPLLTSQRHKDGDGGSSIKHTKVTFADHPAPTSPSSSSTLLDPVSPPTTTGSKIKGSDATERHWPENRKTNKSSRSSRKKRNDKRDKRRRQSQQSQSQTQTRNQRSPPADTTTHTGPHQIICPYWLQSGVICPYDRGVNVGEEKSCCPFAHALLPDRPRERLECRAWRTGRGCHKPGCLFEHHRTLHGVARDSFGTKVMQ